jgi:prohibitin 2
MNSGAKAAKEMFSKMKGMGGGGGGGGQSGTAAALIGLAGLAYGGSYVFNNAIVSIQPGHLGMTYSRLGGLSDQATLREGMNFVIPWFQRPVVYDIRTRPQMISSQSGSKDLQTIQIQLRVLYRPDPTELPLIYRKLGKDFDERVLPSIVNEVTKSVVAKYNASELLTKRDMVSKQIREMLMKRAFDFKIVLDDVSITHLAFSREYTAAVEAKQVAQQDAERSKYIVERALQEKRQIVIRADGEAKSAELIGTAIQDNPAFVELRKIEAARDVANIVSHSTNKVYLDADALLLNNLAEGAKEEKTNEKKKGWM